VLGLADVPVRVLDIEAAIRGEAEENAQRLGFSPEEGVEVFGAVLEEEKLLARGRQKEAARRAGIESGRSRRGERDTNVPKNLRNVQDQEIRGESRELAANVTGYSWRSLDMAGEVVGHAVEEPDTFQPIREEMNRSRNIGKAHAAAQAARHLAKLIHASHEAQAECLRLVLRAETRMVVEVQAGRERGEIAVRDDNLRRGPDARTSGVGKATLPEIGIDRRRLREWCILASVPDDIMEH
jgi:hypothetical protein